MNPMEVEKDCADERILAFRERLKYYLDLTEDPFLWDRPGCETVQYQKNRIRILLDACFRLSRISKKRFVPSSLGSPFFQKVSLTSFGTTRSITICPFTVLASSS